jgi:hypothetical protein
MRGVNGVAVATAATSDRHTARLAIDGVADPNLTVDEENHAALAVPSGTPRLHFPVSGSD